MLFSLVQRIGLKKGGCFYALNKEVKDFSIEVINNRAIPSVIDGFKASQRKVVFAGEVMIATLRDGDETNSCL